MDTKFCITGWPLEAGLQGEWEEPERFKPSSNFKSAVLSPERVFKVTHKHLQIKTVK